MTDVEASAAQPDESPEVPARSTDPVETGEPDPESAIAAAEAALKKVESAVRHDDAEGAATDPIAEALRLIESGDMRSTASERRAGLAETLRDAEDPIRAALDWVEQADSVSPQNAGEAMNPESARRLESVDQELAGDVDHLLQGSFQTVREVLDDVFDEGTVQPLPIDVDLAENLVDESEPELLDDPASVQTEWAAVTATPPDQAPPDQTQAPGVPSDDDADPVPTPPVVDDVEFGSDVDVVAFDEFELATLEPPELEQDLDAEVRGDPGAVAVVERPAEAARPSPIPKAIEAGAVSVLRLVNYPIRFVPPGARPLVDWVALSLLIWVPIVWFAALFLL